MKRYGKLMALFLTVVMSLAMSMTVFAATKTDIIAAMDAAAAELGVQNSQQYQNARASVAAYEGTVTDEQYSAAIQQIDSVKATIQSEGVEAIKNDSAKLDALVAQVVSAAEAVGVKIQYSGNGVAAVVSNSGGSSGGSSGTNSSPIKQTGADYTAAVVMIVVLAAGFAVSTAAIGVRKRYSA